LPTKSCCSSERKHEPGERVAHRIGLLASEAPRGLDAAAELHKLQCALQRGSAVKLALHKGLQLGAKVGVREREHGRRRQVAAGEVLTLMHTSSNTLSRPPDLINEDGAGVS
jgi:hypothetical protein